MKWSLAFSHQLQRAPILPPGRRHRPACSLPYSMLQSEKAAAEGLASQLPKLARQVTLPLACEAFSHASYQQQCGHMSLLYVTTLVMLCNLQKTLKPLCLHLSWQVAGAAAYNDCLHHAFQYAACSGMFLLTYALHVDVQENLRSPEGAAVGKSSRPPHTSSCQQSCMGGLSCRSLHCPLALATEWTL